MPVEKSTKTRQIPARDNHWFRGTPVLDEAIHAKLQAERAKGRRVSESSVIIDALLLSPYLFPATDEAEKAEKLKAFEFERLLVHAKRSAP